MLMKNLKNILVVNAMSSGLTGLLLTMDAQLFANLFGTSAHAPFVGVGMFLIAFAAGVFFVSRRKDHWSREVPIVVTADTLWVIVSAVILFLRPFAITWIGYSFIAAVAAWVALMAFLQFTSLRRVNNPTI